METTFTYSSGVSSGGIYRFQYRSKNINGYSDFSQITYVRAARVPYRPIKPTFSTATATSLTINFNQAVLDGGSDITAFELHRNTGGTSTTFAQVTTYDGQSSSATLTTTDDGIETSKIYKFMYRAVN